MSRIGQKPVKVPAGVKVELSGAQLKLTGGQDSLMLRLHPRVEVEYDGKAGEIQVRRRGEERLDRALHGTTRALIANMVQGVTQGYQKSISIYGTGYSVEVKGQQLVLKVGYGHPVYLEVPGGVKVDVKTAGARGNDVPAEFTVRGADKWAVGQFAAAIRAVRPPEPYLGKGIRYTGERVRRKVGKAFGSTA